MQDLLICSDCKEATQNLINDGIKVDLIYLDPPFNSNRNYFFSNNIKAFSDIWQINLDTQQYLSQSQKLIHKLDLSNLVKNLFQAWIDNFNNISVKDKSMFVYLVYMAERLVLMKKVLKPTGSIYYHCDPTASHYIKIIMDGIFGRENFRNEIVWCYKGGGVSRKDFGRKHDVIFWYSINNKNYYFNQLKERAYLDKSKGYNNKVKWLIDENGKEYKLTNIRDVWNIQPIAPSSKERVSYPTQKPVALLNRIIKASCSQGGIVLDPFCGSGTTIISAVENKVNWIGIDISHNALSIIKNRLKCINHYGFNTI